MIDNLCLDKYLGAMLGAVVGDALGWPYEDCSKNINPLKDIRMRNHFLEWTRRSGGQYYRHQEVIKAGEYSDDTQLLLATARSLIHKQDWSKAFLMQELTAWLIYERGGGGATLRAAQSWSKGIVPWKNKELHEKYFDAGGNGVAMRILPHIYVSRDSFSEITKQVMLNGIYTHGHPRALLGAIIYAKAIHYLLNKNDTLGFGELVEVLQKNAIEWSEFPRWHNVQEWLEVANNVTNGNYLRVWEATVQELKDGLVIIKDAIDEGVLDTTQATLSRLNCFHPHVRGSGTVAALVSIYIASKYASDPNTGLLEVLSLDKADTDTLASMVGGLLGTIYGSEWIKNEWNAVQDYEYIVSIIKKSFCVDKSTNKINSWMERKNYGIKQKLKALHIGDEIEFSHFGQMKVLEKKLLHTEVSNLEVYSTKFETEEGQTIYIKNFIKTIPEVKSKSIPEKSDNKDSKDLTVAMTNSDFEELSALLPGRFSGKRTLCLIAEAIRLLQDKSTADYENIESISTKLVQNGITLNEVRSVVRALQNIIKEKSVP